MKRMKRGGKAKAASVLIVDYGMGNLRSVAKAFEASKCKAVLSDSPESLEGAAKIVLPGVGSFGQAMRELTRRGWVDALKDKIRSGTPYLGICLGLQLLFEEGEEGGRVKGLGIIPGKVCKIREARADASGAKLKIPHMGWNTAAWTKKGCPLTADLPREDWFYFVHSFVGEPEDKSWVLAETRYGAPFCSAVWKGNVFATQFHPEKSQASGLRMIRNFVNFK